MGHSGCQRSLGREHLALTVVELWGWEKESNGPSLSSHSCKWIYVDTQTVLFCRRQKVWWFRDWVPESSSPVPVTLGPTASSPIESQRC